jgi:pyroglutamyl-peptidase
MKILFTSFDTWEPHQTSNSSDDLLNAIIERNGFSHVSNIECYFAKKILVDFQVAPKQVISKLNELQPDLVICCGMAESRQSLSIESTGRFLDETLVTEVDLEDLIETTIKTYISHDAGNFVCNHLYYSLLNYQREQNLSYRCLFVHVPVLAEGNLETIIHDFLAIVKRLSS